MRFSLLLALAAVLTLAACTPKAAAVVTPAPEPNPRLNDIWALQRIGVEDLDPASLPEGIELPTIEFQLAEQRVGGTDGCNNFSGQLLEVGDRVVKFSPLASTRKYCAGSRLPERVTAALQQVATYQIDGLTLSLLNEAGAEILRYRKVD